MIPSTPSVIPQPFANAGQRNVIEDSSTVAGAPNATWAQGFPPITMMNKQAGGKPPLGKDMNGVLNALSQHAFFQQSGSVYPWNAELNYLGGSHVMGSDGLEYIAVAPSGPEVPIAGGYVGAQDPTTDTAQAYWVPMADFYGSKRNVGETVFSLVPLDDAGLHLLDGSLISTTGVYAEGAAAIIALRPNYPSLFTSETMWQQSVNQYGVCGKFVYDEGAGTLRLPKVTGHIAGTVDATALGDLVEAGLPNISGTVFVYAQDGGSGFGFYTTGAFVGGNPSPTCVSVTPAATYAGNGRADLDASRSSPIYGNSTTVQPQAIKGFLYMVLANRPKTPIQVDIDNIAADLALKADISLGNVNSTGQAAMAHAAMPDTRPSAFITLSLPATDGTVTAPADGFVIMTASSNATHSGINLACGYTNRVIASGAGQDLSVCVMAAAGDTCRVSYYDVTNPQLFFRYANGSAPQP